MDCLYCSRRPATPIEALTQESREQSWVKDYRRKNFQRKQHGMKKHVTKKEKSRKIREEKEWKCDMVQK